MNTDRNAAPGSVHRADRREELLDAAITGIRTHGASASMDQLAAAAGITKPILYRHFGDRAGLINAIADRFATQLERELLTSINEVTDGTHELLVRTVDAFVAYIEADPALYRFIVQPQYDPAIDLGGFLDRISSYIAVAIGEQLRSLGRDSGGAEVIRAGRGGLRARIGRLVGRPQDDAARPTRRLRGRFLDQRIQRTMGRPVMNLLAAVDRSGEVLKSWTPFYGAARRLRRHR